MRAKEFINESSIGRYVSGGTVPSMTPITKKNAKIAYDTVRSISNAESPRDKIEIITNLSTGKTSNKITVLGPDDKQYGFRAYDKESGTLTVGDSVNKFTVDVDSLEFIGKERSVSTTIKKWVFRAQELELQPNTEPKKVTGSKRGRPSKPTYNMPNRLW